MAEAAAAGVAIESLTKQLRALKQELATLDPNTAKFQELALQAGQVKDQINDASEAMNANAGSAFERLSNNANLLKDRLFNLDFEGVTSSVKGLAGQVGNVSFKGAISGIKDFGGALKALGTALLTNPIFLLVAAIAAIGMAVKALLDDQRNDVDEANKSIDASNEQRHNLERLRMAEAAGNEKALSDLKRKSMKEDIKDTKDKIDNLMWMEKQAYGLSDEQEKQLDELRKKYSQQRVDYEIQAVNEMMNLNRMILENEKTIYQSKLSAREIELQSLDEWFAKQLTMAGDNERALEAANDAYFVKKGQITDKFNKEDAAKSKASRDKRAADDKAAADAFLKAQEEISAQILEWQNEDAAAEVAANEARLKIQEGYYKAQQSLVTDAKEMEIDALVADYDARFELANGNAEIEKALAEQQKKDIADIEEKYRKEKEDKDKEAADKEKARLQSITDFKIQTIQDSLTLISTLTDVFNNGSEKSARKAFAVNKAASIAQTLITTYLSAQKAFASQVNPLDPSSIVRGQIAAGLAIAGGLANVAKIAKTQFNGGGGGGGSASGGGGGGSLGGGGGGSSMTSVTPAFNPLNTSFLNNRPAQTGAVQAYVLSSNVSSAMEANQKVKDQTVL
jgi:ribosomal protein L29